MLRTIWSAHLALHSLTWTCSSIHNAPPPCHSQPEVAHLLAQLILQLKGPSDVGFAQKSNTQKTRESFHFHPQISVSQ
ncbi:hypothetical protein Fmac_004169 [Flemingia macrophylla]|uniref:Secreted protein n=1 Tax=Flemingia macrophylla TaxID=520843 RepID=A0ABD1N4B8_9FABA